MHLERISLEQGSSAVSLVAPLTVAAAVTTASLSTTTVSTATSRTREDSTTREVSTARALTRTETPTGRASAGTTRGGPGATPPGGATTAETCRPRRDIQTTPGPTRPAATKDDEGCEYE